MAKKIMICLVLAVIAAGGAFAQVVVSAGGGIDVVGSEDKSTGTTIKDTTTDWKIDLEGGYRMGLMGFGLHAGFGGGEEKNETGSTTITIKHPFGLKIGGYFEYALLQLGKFSFFGKAGLGYRGIFDGYGPNNTQRVVSYNAGGFYLDADAVFEYQMFKHAAFFASVKALDFSVITWEAKGFIIPNTPGFSSDAYPKTTVVNFDLPWTHTISAITLGCKFIF
ncbi:MAG: hypothetical protein LBG90_09290 [Spirochaetaceae bacterium]|nr:hypothetical protein [Spirochaetaceae bacterium]